jgi:hypothetical protein
VLTLSAGHLDRTAVAMAEFLKIFFFQISVRTLCYYSRVKLEKLDGMGE